MGRHCKTFPSIQPFTSIAINTTHMIFDLTTTTGYASDTQHVAPVGVLSANTSIISRKLAPHSLAALGTTRQAGRQLAFR